jgi:hypothetical protein
VNGCQEKGVDAGRQELLGVLRDARSTLAAPDNDFAWSSWPDAGAALRELDGLIGTLEEGGLPSRARLSTLFAPTGPIQEVSLSGGWGESFLVLAQRFDAAAAKVYGHPKG